MAFRVKAFMDVSRFLDDSKDRILVLTVFDSSFFCPARYPEVSSIDCDGMRRGIGTSGIVDCRTPTPPEILRGWPIGRLDFSNTFGDGNEFFLPLTS